MNAHSWLMLWMRFVPQRGTPVTPSSPVSTSGFRNLDPSGRHHRPFSPIAQGRKVASIVELARTHTDLDSDAVAHLARLTLSWGILADFCFADLLLVTREVAQPQNFVVLAHVRPTTGQTLYHVDLVGMVIKPEDRSLLGRAWGLGEIVEGDSNVLLGEERVRVECIPVRRGGKVIALLSRETTAAAGGGRRLGELERVYLEIFDQFASMISAGSFPYEGDGPEPEEAPRVGDGVILLDEDARARYASPNAVSVLHRMDIHANPEGLLLAEVGFDEDAVRNALALRAPVVEEIERGDTSVLVRVIPLLDGSDIAGAVVLLRDVSELRRRDRMLLSKDATIREIHHRVKNNLQTIASLLRLQGRRMASSEAKIALEESVQRIRAIALVHETLARESGDFVSFADVIRPLVRMVNDGVDTHERSLSFTVDGEAGQLPADVATPLAVVLNELIQNALDHAFPADGVGDRRVSVLLARDGADVMMEVRDNGVGFPPGFSIEQSDGLGLSIVHTLVTSELGGSIAISNDDGARTVIRVPASIAPRVER